VRVVILRLKRTHSIDATVLTVLESFLDAMNKTDKHVILCGISGPMSDKLNNFGLTKKIGHDNIFMQRFGVFQSAQQALLRAKELVGSSVDVEGLRQEKDELENWSYQI